MKKCFILGGTGFIGEYLLKRLIDNGYTVRMLVHKRPISILDSRIESVHMNFSDIQNFDDYVIDCDCVIHLVSTTKPNSINKDIVEEINSNVIPSIRLLESCAKYNRKVIFISSGGTVYGENENLPTKETSNTLPICTYGIQKLMIEKYIYVFGIKHQLDYVILRLSNPYGYYKGMNNGLVSTVIRKTYCNEDITVFGDGCNIRDYIYIKDAVEAILCAINYKGKSENHIFNVGTGKGYSINEIIAQVFNVIGKSTRVTHVDSRYFDVKKNILDTEKTRELLKFSYKVDISEGIRLCYESFLKNKI